MAFDDPAGPGLSPDEEAAFASLVEPIASHDARRSARRITFGVLATVAALVVCVATFAVALPAAALAYLGAVGAAVVAGDALAARVPHLTATFAARWARRPVPPSPRWPR